MGAGGQAMPDVVLDCRWLGIGGPGRVTELLLQGLALDPPHDWLLWGPAAVRDHAWPGAAVQPASGDPRRGRGQRDWFAVPPAGVVVFLHQQRPLRNLPSVTLIHDTIQLRYAPHRWEQAARAAYLRRVAAVSREILTVSNYARDCIRRDLGVGDDRITVAPLPVDEELADRVRAARRGGEIAEIALYVGQFAPHKNLEALVAAFGRTRFCADGGRLVLVGGTGVEAAGLRARLSAEDRLFVDVRAWSSQQQLEALLASARLLVQPSLEEGFGLPVQEAMAAGVAVCVSDGGALPETTRGLVPPFPATSVEAMAAAIDERVERSRAYPEEAERVAEELRRRAPSVADFAAAVSAVVDRQLAPAGR